ncbi:MAG: choice-of-anchor D domain-containing protein, partial [Bacteroidota bacterium]
MPVLLCLLLGFLGALSAGSSGCGSSPKVTRVTITVDGAALGPEKLAAIRTIRLRVEKDLQVVDRNFPIAAGTLANGQYEVTYSPLSKTGMLRVVITALDAEGNVLATNSADVTIKTGRNSTVTVALSGMAPPEALLVVTPAAVDFGDVVLGEPAGRMMVTLRNAGGASLGPLVAALHGDTVSFVVDPTTTCDGVVLAPNETCALAIEFRPTEAGAREGHLLASASPGGEVRVDFTGRGVGASAVMIDPDVADLGSVQVGQTGVGVKFTVTNSGGQSTGAVVAALSGTHAAEMTIGNDGCSGKTLAAGASCTLTIALAPASAGPKTGTLTVSGLLAFNLAALAAPPENDTFLAAGGGGSSSAELT